MGPPAAAPPMQRSASQLDYKSSRTPKMTPRQKSCDDMKRHTVQRNTMREGRTRATPRSTTSQRKFLSFTVISNTEFYKTFLLKIFLCIKGLIFV